MPCPNQWFPVCASDYCQRCCTLPRSPPQKKKHKQTTNKTTPNKHTKLQHLRVMDNVEVLWKTSSLPWENATSIAMGSLYALLLENIVELQLHITARFCERSRLAPHRRSPGHPGLPSDPSLTSDSATLSKARVGVGFGFGVHVRLVLGPRSLGFRV